MTTVAYSLASIFGVADLDEAIDGRDIHTSEKLDSTTRWSRGLIGFGTIILSALPIVPKVNLTGKAALEGEAAAGGAAREIAEVPGTNTPSYSKASPKYRNLSPEADSETRELVAQIREENNVPIPESAKSTHWPQQTGDLENGLKFNRPLTAEELARLSELYQAEFEQIVYQDGTVLIRKGPSVGSNDLIPHPEHGNPAGRSVGGGFPNKQNIIRVEHTHPSATIGREIPSIEDLFRGGDLIKYIITRNRNGKAYKIPISKLN